MTQITLKPIRQQTTVTLLATLTDNGVKIDWRYLDVVKAYIYSESQRVVAGPCTVQVDGEDPTILRCVYDASKPQYLGPQKLVIYCEYSGQKNTYDKAAFVFVASTAATTDDGTTVSEDTTDVDITVEDVSSSILAGAIEAALEAAEFANETAESVQERADQDHTRAEEDHSTAASDHTRAAADHTVAAADHTQAAADHNLASADHLQAGLDHTQAAADHGVAVLDHGQAGQDHTRAESDHDTAASDHTKAGQDHTRAESDHTQAAADHTLAGTDHSTAAADHTQAASDHTAAAADHTLAAADHSTAAADHTQALADHQVMQGYDTRLTQAETDISQLGQDVTDLELAAMAGFSPVNYISSQAGYLLNAYGNIAESANFTIYAYAAAEGDVFTIHTNTVNNYAICSFFDTNGNKIPSTLAVNTGETRDADAFVVAPHGAVTMYVSCHNAFASNLYVKKSNTNNFANAIGMVDYPAIISQENAKFINASTGAISNGVGANRLDTYEVSVGQIYFVDCMSLTSGAATIAFFNSITIGAESYMPQFSIVGTASDEHISVIVPQGAVRMCISYLYDNGRYQYRVRCSQKGLDINKYFTPSTELQAQIDKGVVAYNELDCSYLPIGDALSNNIVSNLYLKTNNSTLTAVSNSASIYYYAAANEDRYLYIDQLINGYTSIPSAGAFLVDSISDLVEGTIIPESDILITPEYIPEDSSRSVQQEVLVPANRILCVLHIQVYTGTHMNVYNTEISSLLLDEIQSAIGELEDEMDNIDVSVNNLIGLEAIPSETNPLKFIKQTAGYTSIFRKMGVIGGSMSTGVHAKTEGSTSDNLPEYSTLQFMARMCEAEGFNFSKGGQSAHEWLGLVQYEKTFTLPANKYLCVSHYVKGDDSYIEMLVEDVAQELGSVSNIYIQKITTGTYAGGGRVRVPSETDNDLKIYYLAPSETSRSVTIRQKITCYNENYLAAIFLTDNVSTDTDGDLKTYAYITAADTLQQSERYGFVYGGTSDYFKTNLCQMYLIQLGNNDLKYVNPSDTLYDSNYSLGTTADLAGSNGVFANTFFGKMGAILAWIRQYQPRAYIFLSTFFNGYGVVPPSYAPDFDYNQAIRDIVAYYQVAANRPEGDELHYYLIDYYTYGSTWASFNEGIHAGTVRGSHLVATGYLKMAYEYCTYIDWIIKNNMSDFNDVAWVGTDNYYE